MYVWGFFMGNMMTKIDLHSHSTCSDGTNTPEQLVELANQAGIQMLALTDHDTIAGVQVAKQYANDKGIKLIDGVEISCHHGVAGGYGKQQQIQKTIHVVALNFKDTKLMHKTLQALQDSRHERGYQMVVLLGKLLAQDGDASALSQKIWQSVLQKAQNNPRAVGRAHIAQVLHEMGYVPSIQSAFDKYLADGKSAYVAIQTMSMAQTIELIHRCDGLAVLAHPTRYGLSATRTRKLIADFADLGGDACELPNNEPQSLRAMIDRCVAQHGLMVSVGSDFHGSNMPWRKLGSVAKPNNEQVGVWTRFR